MTLGLNRTLQTTPKHKWPKKFTFGLAKSLHTDAKSSLEQEEYVHHPQNEQLMDGKTCAELQCPVKNTQGTNRIICRN